MGQEKGVNQRAGVTNRNLGTNYTVVVDGFRQLNSTPDTTRFTRTRTNVTDIAAFVVKYPNNTTKANWVGNVSPKNK
jgi:hypothetical protein